MKTQQLRDFSLCAVRDAESMSQTSITSTRVLFFCTGPAMVALTEVSRSGMSLKCVVGRNERERRWLPEEFRGEDGFDVRLGSGQQ